MHNFTMQVKSKSMHCDQTMYILYAVHAQHGELDKVNNINIQTCMYIHTIHVTSRIYRFLHILQGIACTHTYFLIIINYIFYVYSCTNCGSISIIYTLYTYKIHTILLISVGFVIIQQAEQNAKCGFIDTVGCCISQCIFFLS